MNMENSMKKPRRKGVDRVVILLVSLVLVLGAVIGGTLGYLTSQVKVTNTMEPGTINTEIDEELNDNVKSNVTVKNTGNSDAYIRAVVVVTWQNEEGEVYPQVPVAGTDYTITYGTDWENEGQFYYYKGVVPGGQTTSNLIVSCEPQGNQAPEGYDLNVEILASAIQSEPADAVKEAWKMQYINGKWACVE